MEPQSITTNTIVSKIILISIGLILLFPMVTEGFYFGNIEDALFRLLLGLGATCAGIYYLRNPTRVKFDENYLYIHKGKKVKEIPLEYVYQIELTTIKEPGGRVWKICYKELNNKRDSIRITPPVWSDNFKFFKEKVKEKNPHLIIETFALYW